ncbi:hypothetical protein KFL_002760140 [Klebsormidium nitens]|uniref:Uncharacterized protein n=1 Tax=Klebsormidium nitens TaxID=105231 RepID=A0A1Y1IBW2_KLENI|nr:hypothetical protein KFL_002760140 [Klebsormidium nitens]|eukprot:GAQ86217.1 hypothetical protein KFL_002760140 [Klebsormidium nitens]
MFRSTEIPLNLASWLSEDGDGQSSIEEEAEAGLKLSERGIYICMSPGCARKTGQAKRILQFLDHKPLI